jgi:hypothetical protein
MKAKKLSLAALTVLVLVAAAGVAWGFVIENEEALDRVSQIVNLRGTSTTGELNFSSVVRVMPNGTEVPFVIPAGHVLLITKFYFDFKTASAEPNANVRLEPFLGPAANGSGIVGGNTSGASTFASGCPVGPRSPGSPAYLIRAVIPGVGTTIPGDLNVQITGFLLNPTAAMPPVYYLLLEP